MLLLRVSVSQSQVNVKWGGTCRRHFNTQVNKRGIRHLEMYRDNDVPCSLNVRYLCYFSELTLLGRISGMDSVLPSS